jgi:hypothetical protein
LLWLVRGQGPRDQLFAFVCVMFYAVVASCSCCCVVAVVVVVGVDVVVVAVAVAAAAVDVVAAVATVVEGLWGPWVCVLLVWGVLAS